MSAPYFLYGIHPVTAALSNPRRVVLELLGTPNAWSKIERYWKKNEHPAYKTVDSKQFHKLLPPDVVHQGVAAKVRPLPAVALDQLLEKPLAPLLMLDQVTDPHNIGAILRTAAAFGVRGIVVHDRSTPEENGVLAKAASGGLEVVPLVRVSNLVQALETLKSAGYWPAGLDGGAKVTLAQAKLGADTVLVLGAEGKGLRRLTAEHCDILVKIAMPGNMQSLNVSNAAAIACYQLSEQTS